MANCNRFPQCLICGFLALLICMSVQAAGYKCADKDGRFTYTDQPCPESQPGKKIMERGAGYSSLTDTEKKQFFGIYLSGCTTSATRQFPTLDVSQINAFCNCTGERITNTVQYEELMEYNRTKTFSSNLKSRVDEATKRCAGG